MPRFSKYFGPFHGSMVWAISKKQLCHSPAKTGDGTFEKNENPGSRGPWARLLRSRYLLENGKERGLLSALPRAVSQSWEAMKASFLFH